MPPPRPNQHAPSRTLAAGSVLCEHTEPRCNNSGPGALRVYRVKICGVRTEADALAAADAGADAIGLNFYPRSKRRLTRDQAAGVAAAARGRVACVGVFVNEPADRIRRLVDQLGLHAIQLHGDEPPDTVARLAPTPVILARRIGPSGMAGVAGDVTACRAAGRPPAALLADAPVAGGYGGGGEPFDWRQVADRGESLGGVPLMLAGGLTPENVAEAIRVARPEGVDVASGVERSPGEKDPLRVAAFVAAALGELVGGG